MFQCKLFVASSCGMLVNWESASRLPIKSSVFCSTFFSAKANGAHNSGWQHFQKAGYVKQYIWGNKEIPKKSWE